MVTHELFVGACHLYTAIRQTFFEPLDLLQVVLVGISDQGMDKDAAGGGFDQRLLDLQPVQSIDNDFNACFGLDQISAKKAAMSRARSSGSSAAAKCPPLGIEVHRRTS